MKEKTNERFVRACDYFAELGIHPSTGWRYIRKGLLPKPLKLTPSTVGWFREDLDKWEADRRAASYAPRDMSAQVEARISGASA